MILSILFLFLLCIKKSMTNIDLNQNTYYLTFSSYFKQSPIKLILKSQDSLERVIYENNSEDNFIWNLSFIVSIGDSIKIQFSNSNKVEEINSIQFAFIIILDNSKGNKNKFFHNETNIINMGETLINQVYLNDYMINLNTINEMEISFNIPKIYQCKNEKLWLGKNELI